MKKILIMSLYCFFVFSCAEGYYHARDYFNMNDGDISYDQDYYGQLPIGQAEYYYETSEYYPQNGYYYSQEREYDAPNGNANQTEVSAKEEKHINEIQKKYPQDRAASLNDRQLNAKIRDKISEGWFWRSYETVKLDTNNGVVFLEGFVEKPADQEKIITEIRKIPGVKGVNSNLQINKK